MTKTRMILKKIHHVVLTTAELMESFIPGYSETYEAMHKKVRGCTYPQKPNPQQWKRQQEKTFYTLLSRLKEHDLIEKQKTGSKSLWKITKKGTEYLEKSENNQTEVLPRKDYSKSLDRVFNIVIFDIPEKFKHKRIWLRQQLKNLDFVMLQKSVWIGKYKIPEGLVYDIETLKLLPYIHILKVYKTGSIANLKL